VEGALIPKPQDVSFDLNRALSSVVSIHAVVPADALTASVLGTERAGHGVVIDADGLIVTIGYVITEAEQVWITTCENQVIPGYVVGYDYESGFGLVKATQTLRCPVMSMGSSEELKVDDQAIVAGYGGAESSILGTVIAKHEFAGYWEYVLDEALFTAPAHESWGGAAVIDEQGQLCGIGSLLVQRVDETGQLSGANMSVPIDLLKPIFDDLCSFGRRAEAARPWVGFLVQDVGDQLIVSGVYEDCPADVAGLTPGDEITHINGVEPETLADLFRQIWEVGEAGVAVPITVNRNNERQEIVVNSVDRDLILKTGQLH